VPSTPLAGRKSELAPGPGPFPREAEGEEEQGGVD